MLIGSARPKTARGALSGGTVAGGHNERREYDCAVHLNSPMEGLASKDKQKKQELLLGT